MLAIRLTNDIEERLNKLAIKTGRTKTYYAREAILEFLQDMEDKYLALERIENSEGYISQDEIEKELGLEY
jgi:RHH-type transcriptional regulator, rel operon repressor / antitoxin RelB